MTFVLSMNEPSTIQFSKKLVATFMGGTIRQYTSIVILYSHRSCLFKYPVEYKKKSIHTLYALYEYY